MKRNALRGVLTVSVALGLIGVGSAANAVPDPTSAVLTPASGPVAGGTEVTFEAPPGVTFTQVTAGDWHSVALATDGTWYTWGYNAQGQLGDDTTTDRRVPVPVQTPAGVTFTQVSAGANHSVALATDGTAYAWGHNADGQLGDGTTTGRRVPVPVQMPAGVTFTQVGAGANHSVALATDGTAYAWGYNAYGQLGDDTVSGIHAPVPVPVEMPAGVTFTQVSAGSMHTVALATDGTAYAWGYNVYGQLGDDMVSGSHAPVPVPVEMPAGVTFTQVRAGAWHSLALATDGTAYAWGYNSLGQLGNGATAESHVPVGVQMPAGVRFTQVSGGEWFSLALATDGTAYAWGYNRVGQLGNGTFVDSIVPLQVQAPAGVTFTQVGAGGSHSVALAADGTGYAWGYNGFGQLPDGSPTSRTVPTPVRTDTTVTGVSFGGATGSDLVDNGDGTWTVTAPPHAAGLVDVTVSWAMYGVTQPDITHAGAFTYAVPDVAPTVTDPSDQAVTVGDTATFTVEADGTPSPMVGWEVSADKGATWNAVTVADGTVTSDGTTLKVVATEALSGAQYRATATNSAGTGTSAAATLTVSAVTVVPTVTDPVDQAVTAGDTATFAVDAAGTPAPAVAWELSLDDGATWDAVTADDGTVSGDGTTLKVVATEALSGAKYRAAATNSAGTQTSAAATLTVVPVAPVTPVIDHQGESGGVAEKGLARTGSQAAPSIAAAALTLLAGTALVLAARRKRV